MKEDLLDELAEAVGCLYLSDLRQIENYKEMVYYLDEIEEWKYPEKQWRNAIVYILGDKAGKPSEGESLKEYLCREIRKSY